MKISIIIPVFNVESFICECIESIIIQSYEAYEIILIDDGSSDGSSELCDMFSLKYPDNIVTLHSDNRGPFHARIQGMRKATGDIFVFLDADDCLCNCTLEDISKCFMEKNCDMVLYNAGVTAAFQSKKVEYPFKNGQTFEGHSKKILYQKLLTGEIPNSVCLKAIRADIFPLQEEFNSYPKIKYGEDLLLSALFITNCNKIVYLNKALYYYRMRSGSSIHTFDSEKNKTIKFVHERLAEYITRWDLPEYKRLHNTRKVKGWIDHLSLLICNKRSMHRHIFIKQMKNMADDPYFRSAYSNMEKKRLSIYHRMLAFLLFQKSLFLLDKLVMLKYVIQKRKFL